MAKCFNCDTEIGAGSKRQLDALALRDTLGKSYTDIATELGVSRQRAARLVEGGLQGYRQTAPQLLSRSRSRCVNGSPAHAGIDRSA